MQYKEITNEINNIKNTKFNERTLRDLQILTKKINLCIKQQNLSNIEAFNIYLKLKKLINYKLTEVSAPKSKNLTNKLLPILNQNYNKIPSDITIIDNDLILLCNKPYDTPIIKDEILTIQNNDYQEITEQYSIETFQNIYKTLKTTTKTPTTSICNFYFPTTEETDQQSINTIIKNINILLCPYNNYLKKSIDIDSKTKKIIYSKKSTMKIYTNKSLKDIIVSIFQNETISFNLVATNDWNEIYCYQITQYSPKNRPCSWCIEKTNLDIWNLTKNIENKKKLTKKRIDNK